MAEPESITEQEIADPRVSPRMSPKRAAAKAKKEIQDRCAAAGLKCEDAVGHDSKPVFKVGIRCGRDVRWVYLESAENILEFSSINFEKWVFLSGCIAICCYGDGYIEAAFRSPSHGVFGSSIFQLRRMFGPPIRTSDSITDFSSVKLMLEPPQDDLPRIEISPPSEAFKKLSTHGFERLTLKLISSKVTTHDQALSLLRRLAGSTFFQIDLLSDVPLTLSNDSVARRAQKRAGNLAAELQYPRTEFDSAPFSLYWYGRSASGMPLLQFLAFYQVIEFYFPIYSKADAQRRLKAVLKDPTFRGDRDADIGKLLSSIYISRSGAYGDERSQLRATLMECTDDGDLRAFLESDPDRRDFYLAKVKSSPYHRISLGSPSADLRSDVSERIYEIRCKIVHTKSDAHDENLELLLPFSKEAEQLFFDIQLVRYLAQRVLITASLPLQTTG